MSLRQRRQLAEIETPECSRDSDETAYIVEIPIETAEIRKKKGEHSLLLPPPGYATGLQILLKTVTSLSLVENITSDSYFGDV